MRASGDEKLRAFVQALPDLLFVLDEDGRYIEALTSNEHLLYARSKELIGRRMHDVLPRDKADLFLKTVLRTLRTGKSQVLEYDLAVPAGTRYFEGRTSPLNATRRGRRLVVWISRDVTAHRRLDLRLRAQMREKRRAYDALRRAQEQLVRTEKFASIGMLLASVAHEINNPLNVVYGNLRLLADASAPAARPAKRMLADALSAAEQMRATGEKYRNFALDHRPVEVVDVNACLEDAARSVGRPRARSIRVVRRLGRIPKVRCFPDQIRQALSNIVRNAIEAIDGRGTIFLETRRDRRSVVIEIGDSGRGIRGESRPRIFEPFFTTKPAGRGLGLGLAISAMIVHRHNGEISFRDRKGGGTIFRMSLPAEA